MTKEKTKEECIHLTVHIIILKTNKKHTYTQQSHIVLSIKKTKPVILTKKIERLFFINYLNLMLNYPIQIVLID
jgi:hypothetical protein